MESLTKSYDCLGGLDLLRQDYLATLSALESDASLTELERNILCRELAVEHRVRCGQEWKAINIHLRADQDVKT
jgi:hypothetical protein